jgi:phosphatidylserine/phosphatidylglycerophosphate/cardiolipin synthase-like enzyme
MNRRFGPRLQLLALIGLFAAAPVIANPEVQVCFTPEYGSTPSCTQDIVNAIDSARHTILVQAYSFTSAPIAKALVEAHRRSVAVKVILDKSANTHHYSAATFLEHMSVPVWIDAQHAIAHNKVMVIDNVTVITGSFNFTKAAEEHNAENLLIIHDAALASRYTENWTKHLSHSQPYGEEAGPSESQSLPNDENQAEGNEVASEPSSTTGMIVGNRKSRIYAWPGCRTYNRMAPANRMVFPSVQAAAQAGYRAAHDCP